MASHRFNLKRAITELIRLAKAEDKTEAGARLYEALGGYSNYERLAQEIKKSSHGQKILDQRKELLPILTNRQLLRNLPRNTLGFQYIKWADDERLYPEDLQHIMNAAQTSQKDSLFEYIRNRGRDLHDVFHLVTGYDRDWAGEIALLAFTAVQTKNRSLNLLSLLGCVTAAVCLRFDVIRLRSNAKKRAVEAPLLISQNWEKLLQKPLKQVRQDLNLLPAPGYKLFGA